MHNISLLVDDLCFTQVNTKWRLGTINTRRYTKTKVYEYFTFPPVFIITSLLPQHGYWQRKC